MHIFYEPVVKGGEILLNHQESLHCAKVLRLPAGDQVRVVDGKGGLYVAEIAGTTGKQVVLRILDHITGFRPLGYDLHIAIAPTKNIDRYEWFLEKATEIGITSVTPIICRYSERDRIRQDRLERVIISAMKQSEKAYKPVLNQPARFGEWLQKVPAGQTNLIAHCYPSARQQIWNIQPAEATCIAIGPEGDFSEEEVSQAVDAGFVPVTLGDYRLRTETAGVVACSAIYFNQQGK